MDATGVNSDGVWATVSDLARQRGVDKAVVSRQVARFSALGSVQTRPGARGSKLVKVAEYLRAIDATGDAIRSLNADVGRAKGDDEPSTSALSSEQTRRVGIQADLAQLQLDERLGALLPVGDVEKAMTTCAEALVRIIERLPSFADELAAVVAREGAQGLRQRLKALARDQRDRLAGEMRLRRDETQADDEP